MGREGRADPGRRSRAFRAPPRRRVQYLAAHASTGVNQGRSRNPGITSRPLTPYSRCMVSRDPYLAVRSPEVDGAYVGLLAASGAMGFRLPRTNKKLAIRFAVGQPRRRGTIWRLWGVPNANDVYLASRQSAGVFKVSLHESGDWRLQWVRRDSSAFFHGEPKGPSGRILDQWVRTSSRGGWTDALSIWTPGDELVDNPHDSERWDDVQWLEAPPSGRVVELRLVLLQPKVTYSLSGLLADDDDAMALVNGFVLPNDEVVVVLARTSDMNAIQVDGIARHNTGNHALPATFDLDPSTGPRQLVISVDDDGYRNLWDLTLPARKRPDT